MCQNAELSVNALPKLCSKISAEMLLKESRIFCGIYFMPAPLLSAPIGW
jgi:hypothetical protein